MNSLTNEEVTNKLKHLTYQHTDLTRQHKILQHNYLTSDGSDGRNKPPYENI